MKNLVFGLVMLVSVPAMAFPHLHARDAEEITAEKNNGSVILRIKDKFDEKIYLVSQVFQIGGNRAPHDYEIPFGLDRMIPHIDEDDDIDLSACMPRGIIRGVVNWVSDYVYRELLKLIVYPFRD